MPDCIHTCLPPCMAAPTPACRHAWLHPHLPAAMYGCTHTCLPPCMAAPTPACRHAWLHPHLHAAMHGCTHTCLPPCMAAPAQQQEHAPYHTCKPPRLRTKAHPPEVAPHSCATHLLAPHSWATHLLAPHFCVRKLWLRLSMISPSQSVTTGSDACGTLTASMTPHTWPVDMSTPCRQRHRRCARRMRVSNVRCVEPRRRFVIPPPSQPLQCGDGLTGNPLGTFATLVARSFSNTHHCIPPLTSSSPAPNTTSNPTSNPAVKAFQPRCPHSLLCASTPSW
eukprot:355556-Chlamydomonas_euryale.AAC.2